MYCNASIEIKLSVGFQTFYFFYQQKVSICTSNFKSHKSMRRKTLLWKMCSVLTHFLDCFSFPPSLVIQLLVKNKFDLATWICFWGSRSSIVMCLLSKVCCKKTLCNRSSYFWVHHWLQAGPFWPPCSKHEMNLCPIYFASDFIRQIFRWSQASNLYHSLLLLKEKWRFKLTLSDASRRVFV